MITVIHDNKINKDISFVTQQYEVGTYVIINNDPAMQFGISIKEEEYHKKIRIKAIKVGYTIISGSILSCKSKYPINQFKDETN